MSHCCEPNKVSGTAHTLACLLATPDLYVVGGDHDPRRQPDPTAPTEET